MFKSLTVYQLTQANNAVLDRLDAALEGLPFKPCMDKQQKSQGFIKPLGEGSEVISYTTNGGTLFCLRTDEKTVPASAVREKVAARKRDRESKGEEFNKTDERMAKEEFTGPGEVWVHSWNHNAFL